MAQTKDTSKLTNAYAQCKSIVKQNYENFPVASFFLPKHLHNAITTIYAFARTADNYADSTTLQANEKLAALTSLETALLNIAKEQHELPKLAYKDCCANTQCQCEVTESKTPIQDDMMLLAVSDTIHRHDLPITPFLDLLTAFKQDITQSRYYDFGEVLNYCCYSANPIGRLLLHLSKQDSLENLEYADYICTSLQLINFIQDLHHDLTKLDRCYIPLKDLNKFQVSIEDLKNLNCSVNIDALIKHQIERIHTIFNKGLPLGSQLKGLFGFEIRLIIAGGNQILQKLTTRKNYYQRPTLCFKDKIQMLRSSLSINSFTTTEPIMADK